MPLAEQSNDRRAVRRTACKGPRGGERLQAGLRKSGGRVYVRAVVDSGRSTVHVEPRCGGILGAMRQGNNDVAIDRLSQLETR
jgi:hypothetical protein